MSQFLVDMSKFMKDEEAMKIFDQNQIILSKMTFEESTDFIVKYNIDIDKIKGYDERKFLSLLFNKKVTDEEIIIYFKKLNITTTGIFFIIVLDHEREDLLKKILEKNELNCYDALNMILFFITKSAIDSILIPNSVDLLMLYVCKTYNHKYFIELMNLMKFFETYEAMEFLENFMNSYDITSSVFSAEIEKIIKEKKPQAKKINGGESEELKELRAAVTVLSDEKDVQAAEIIEKNEEIDTLKRAKDEIYDDLVALGNQVNESNKSITEHLELLKKINTQITEENEYLKKKCDEKNSINNDVIQIIKNYLNEDTNNVSREEKVNQIISCLIDNK